MLYVGDGNCGVGGDVLIQAGNIYGSSTEAFSGGAVLLRTGLATSTSSGTMTLHTANAGTLGVSGALHFFRGQLQLEIVVNFTSFQVPRRKVMRGSLISMREAATLEELVISR